MIPMVLALIPAIRHLLVVARPRSGWLGPWTAAALSACLVTSAAAFRPAHAAGPQVAGVKVSESAGVVRVEIALTGPAAHRVWETMDPPRVGIDFPGVTTSEDRITVPVNRGPVLRVWAGQFQHTPQIARVMFDLQRSVRVEVTRPGPLVVLATAAISTAGRVLVADIPGTAAETAGTEVARAQSADAQPVAAQGTGTLYAGPRPGTPRPGAPPAGTQTAAAPPAPAALDPGISRGPADPTGAPSRGPTASNQKRQPAAKAPQGTAIGQASPVQPSVQSKPGTSQSATAAPLRKGTAAPRPAAAAQEAARADSQARSSPGAAPAANAQPANTQPANANPAATRLAIAPAPATPAPTAPAQQDPGPGAEVQTPMPAAPAPAASSPTAPVPPTSGGAPGALLIFLLQVAVLAGTLHALQRHRAAARATRAAATPEAETAARWPEDISGPVDAACARLDERIDRAERVLAELQTAAQVATVAPPASSPRRRRARTDPAEAAFRAALATQRTPLRRRRAKADAADQEEFTAPTPLM